MRWRDRHGQVAYLVFFEMGRFDLQLRTGVGKEGRIAPLELAAALGISLSEPSMPAMIEKHQEAEKLAREDAEVWSATLDSRRHGAG